MEESRRVTIWQPLIIVILVLLAAVWLINTLNTGNPLWFSSTQPTYLPERIVLHSYGETSELRTDDPGYAELTEAVNEAFARFRTRDMVAIGLSDETLADYRTDGVVVELIYGEFIQFNLAARMTQVDTLLIPIVGRHSGLNYVFVGRDGEYGAGALQVADRTALDARLRELGYLRSED